MGSTEKNEQEVSPEEEALRDDVAEKARRDFTALFCYEPRADGGQALALLFVGRLLAQLGARAARVALDELLPAQLVELRKLIDVLKDIDETLERLAKTEQSLLVEVQEMRR